MNVTAKHGQAAVHLGGHEFTNGRWSPACGIQHHNVGNREVASLRPTDKEVTCKRCLKVIAKDAEKTQLEAAPAEPTTTIADQIATLRANREAEEEARAAARRARNRTNYAPSATTGEPKFHRQVKNAIGLTW